MSGQPVGQTQGQGWEVGVRHTVEAPPERVWEVLVTQPGLGLWLTKEDVTFEKGADIRTADGVVGKVVGYTEGELIRLRLEMSGMPENSTLQVRIIPNGDRAVLAFYHERLTSANEREAMRDRWNGIIGRLELLL